MEVPLPRSLLVAVALAVAPVALLPSPALAQEEVCAEPLSHAAWLEAMDAADAAIASFEPDKAKGILETVKKQVPCLDTIARPSYIGRFARLMALVAFFEQDEITAVRWGMLQRYAAPELPWPEELTEEHPLREILAFADEPPLAGPDDMGLVFPKKGAVFMNGRVLERPKARAEVPNIVQIADKKGVIVEAYWQDGAAFREEILGPPDVVATAPKWFVPEDPASAAGAGGSLFGEVPGEAVADGGSEPTEDGSGEGATEGADEGAVADATDPEPTPEPISPPRTDRSGPRIGQLIAGGGLGLVAGSLYTVGYLSRDGLGQATTEAELVSARSRVNLMVIGAGAAAAAGVGIGVTAFVSADGGGFGWTTRF